MVGHDEAPQGIGRFTDIKIANLKGTNTGTQINIANSTQFGGATNQFADNANLVLGTTTGTKIATAANQKLSFHGSTPVVQNVHIPDATDAVTAITQLNAVILALEAKGLLASS